MVQAYVLFWIIGFGQNQPFTQLEQKLYTTSNGLCNNNVQAITKDKNGYLWVATTNGISRFDGHFFTNFFHNPTDTASLGHNYVFGIICDQSGTIWILHILGISRFNDEYANFSNFPIKTTYPHFGGTFYCFKEDDSGRLWIGNQNGLALFNTKNAQYLAPEQVNQLFSKTNIHFATETINGVVMGENGSVWFNSHKNIYKLNIWGKQIDSIGLPPFNNVNQSLAINSIDTIHCNLFLGTYTNGLFAYNYKNNTWQHFNTGKEALTTFNYDPVKYFQAYNSEVNVFIGDFILGYFSNREKRLKTISPVPFLPNQIFKCLKVDEKNLWVGSDKGLLLLKVPKKIIKDITPLNRFQGAFSTVQVHEEKSILYSSNYTQNIVFSLPRNGGIKTDLAGVNGILRYFFADKTGTEWLSTENEVFLKKPDEKKWKKIKIVFTDSNLALLPRNFAETPDGSIWLRVRNAGIFKFDRLRQAFLFYAAPAITSNAIYSGLIFHPSSQLLWVSEENSGMYVHNPLHKGWKSHPLFLNSTRLIPAKLASGKAGSIGFADPFNGIGIYNPITQKIKLISQHDGLLSNNVSSIDADTSGNFYTFSSEGVSKIDGETLLVTNLKHPLLANIQEIACDKSDRLFVATSNGLYSIESHLLQPQKSYGKLLLQKVEALGIPLSFNSKKIILPPSTNDITIQYGYIDLYSGEIPFFQYRFENESVWKNLQQRNIISLSRLSPGEYKLFIREKLDDNPKHWQQLSWKIEKPFWQHLYFQLILLMVTILISYFFIQRRIASIREKATLKQKMAETEMAALRAQMNPHFIFNAINCIDAMVQEGDKYNATTYLNKFARLLRNVLEGSRNTTVPLTNDLETLRLYIELECMRMDESFTWQMEIPDEVARADIRVPSLIIQPYVENAIIHGLRHLTDKKGEIFIKVNLLGDALTYRITDNGVGRAFAKNFQRTQHNSFGLEITKSRIEQFNRNNRGSVTIHDLINEEGIAEGTEVLVTLPLN